MPRGIPNTSTPPAVPKISALFKGLGGQNPDLTNLPPEHEVHLIDEAREYYTSERPIFLVDDTKNKLKKPTVSYAFPALPGQMGASGARMSVTTRAWCNESVYQTIDLNRKRIIVKLFKGGPRGCFYRRWMGVIDGFEKPPIAYAVDARRSVSEKQCELERNGGFVNNERGRTWLLVMLSLRPLGRGSHLVRRPSMYPEDGV